MSIRKYIAYLRTVETGSITQAANELGYTQSAVSKMISDLEQDWQVKLLTRNHSGIEISSDGMVLLPTIREIVKGCTEMSKVKTGALIVVGQKDPLSEYERTGIEVDGIVTSQLLINIFEKNTPLHDGAIVVKGDRVTYATCYLPLSDNMRLSKDLGTRHRAGVGISEVSDSMTVIVSEENGKISVAYKGSLSRGLSPQELEEKLKSIQNKTTEDKEHKRWKGWFRNEKNER